MRKSYVYKITCKITGEFYFGSSFRAKSDYYWGGGKRIRERIAQYGKENFVKEILGEFDDRTESHRVENVYIEKFRNDEKCLNQHLDYHFGTYGEESRAKIGAAHRGEKSPWYGKHRTEETRSKMSAAKLGDNHPMYGKHLSEEHRAKIGAAMRGENLSDATRAKMSAAQRGKHRTDATRAKISAALRGKKSPCYGKHWRKNPVTGKREWYD